MCNSAEKENEEDGSESDDEFNAIDADPKVDKEELINKKSPYEQKFIREFRELFSETLNPSRYLKCPPMKIKLRQALSSKLDQLL